MKVLRIRTLERGWHDVDEVMFHAAFQCLVDYMERERPEQINWNDNPERKTAWREIKALYHWWTVTRPNRKSPLDGVKSPSAEYAKACRKHRELTTKWENEDQRQFHRLIDLRGWLWA